MPKRKENRIQELPYERFLRFGPGNLTEAELREAFRREFRALIAIYGKPAKLPEFAVKAGVVL